ncbi:hypothetical protein [Microlunatus soli]|uniref:Gluconate 2-dehydrogenase subunit 3 n=1 Tax=Microlunatus soli TaxID=630515 RepID=A0A1H2AIC6_9ACTN|nr:hypothetical protein [Microlunatus soli]SDT45755.1 hypothetical protein SAMN04489812_5966 [Microlunatus soli]
MSDAEQSDLKPPLVRLLRAAYPHPDFPDGPYERTADTILAATESDVWVRVTLAHGLTTLPEDLTEQSLREMADAEFFGFVRGLAITTLYDDHEVWKLLGYEGASFDQGGYLHRGFDDLDWLPEPRIEEYDGPEPFIEVAEQDRPVGGK